MNWFIWNIMLALVWVTLTGSFSAAGLLAGFIFGYFVLWLIATGTGRRMGYIGKVPQIIGFTFYYAWEVVKANLQVARQVISPGLTMKPGVIGFPLEATSDAAITIFANMVTFTPGTLSLDVSNDRRMLFIHAIDVDDEEQLIADLRDMERRVIALLS